MKVIVDLDACQGYACCMMEAPEVFDLDEDAGKVLLLVESPSEGLRTKTEAAVRACPAKALKLED
ncbi:ferredoxin [Micromonospora chersina]|uniref:ferredoxin n=1 Tax=Micromonospora chersina TaxID=47854 RepID=UPI003721E191